MDQETANVLFDKGAILLFLEAPENLEFGIDFNAWTTGPLFKGVKLIPPGLHFVFYRYPVNTPDYSFDIHMWYPSLIVYAKVQLARRESRECELDSFVFLKLER
jgi:hypothetical protein